MLSHVCVIYNCKFCRVCFNCFSPDILIASISISYLCKNVVLNNLRKNYDLEIRLEFYLKKCMRYIQLSYVGMYIHYIKIQILSPLLFQFINSDLTFLNLRNGHVKCMSHPVLFSHILWDHTRSF